MYVCVSMCTRRRVDTTGRPRGVTRVTLTCGDTSTCDDALTSALDRYSAILQGTVPSVRRAVGLAPGIQPPPVSEE